jgi:ethanolamine utilization protein EutP (predicted NTPase)
MGKNKNGIPRRNPKERKESIRKLLQGYIDKIKLIEPVDIEASRKCIEKYGDKSIFEIQDIIGRGKK